MTYTERFIADINSFLKRHDMAPTRLGIEAVNNPRFVSDLINRVRSPTFATAEKVAEYMRKKDKEYGAYLLGDEK